jgi:hypothetical protein
MKNVVAMGSDIPGASASRFAEAAGEFEMRSVALESLGTWTPPIVTSNARTDFASVKTAMHRKLIQKLNLDKLTEPVARWQQAFPEHSTARNELTGHVTLSVAPAVAEEGEDQSLLTFRETAERVRECLATVPTPPVEERPV